MHGGSYHKELVPNARDAQEWMMTSKERREGAPKARFPAERLTEALLQGSRKVTLANKRVCKERAQGRFWRWETGWCV